MPGRYIDRFQDPQGPGDARPTALEIIKDEGLEGKLTGKVILITGASSGIGVEAARALAMTGAKLYLTARNIKKAEAACASFFQPDQMEFLQLELGSLDSVRKCAKEFLSKSDKLNVLINNAGIMAVPEGKTVDGFENQFGTNHLAHFLLFNLLRDTLLNSSTPESNSRVVCISSSGHRTSGINFDDINYEKAGTYTPFGAYGQSKTANVYMASEIERRYGSQGLHGLSLHPGGIMSGLQKDMPKEILSAWDASPIFAKAIMNAEQGAATTVYAAVSKEWEGKGGKFLERCEEAPKVGDPRDQTAPGYVDHTYNPEAETKLWEVSLKMVGLGGK